MADYRKTFANLLHKFKIPNHFYAASSPVHIPAIKCLSDMAKVTTHNKVVNVESPEKSKPILAKKYSNKTTQLEILQHVATKLHWTRTLTNSNCYQMKDVNIAMAIQRKNIFAYRYRVSNREHRRHWRRYRLEMLYDSQ